MSEQTKEQIADQMTAVIVAYLETLPVDERAKKLKAFVRSLRRSLRLSERAVANAK